ncbi:MAG: hypothetical protein HY718_03900 [Planctomycetes bacterium]|nr:hypothetical protein [Planctomycetota bacterium]
MGLLNDVRMDKTVLKLGKLTDPPDDYEYWQTRPLHERLAAVELMRQIAYGYDPATERLQRLLEVVKREGSDLENLP